MGSYRHRENLVDGGGHFAILQPVCDHSQGKSLDLGYRLFSSLPVNHHSGELRNLRDPPAVVFALDLDEQVHWRPSHTLTRNDVRSQPGAAGPPCLGHSRPGGARNSWKEYHCARAALSISCSMRDFIWLNSSPLYFPCGQGQWIESLAKRGTMCQWQWSMV